MIFAFLIGIMIVLSYALDRHFLSYWSKRGIKQLKPTFFIGNAASLFSFKTSNGEFFADLYNKHKDQKVFGVYMFYTPILTVHDATLVQDIMIRDFTSFHDRPMPIDEKNDPLSGHLFNMAGQSWRDLRVKLSPAFSSGKLKGMFSTVKDCTKVLEDYLVKNVEQGTDVFELRDLMARFGTNVISSVAFGIENDCINEPDHIFRKMGASHFVPTFRNGIKQMVGFLVPSMFHKLGFKLVNPELERFIFSIVNQTVEHREKNNVTRNDFMQLLIQLKNQGYVSVDKGEKETDEAKTAKLNKLDMGGLAAQVFVFFIAGFETTSSTMSFCLYELAKNLSHQQKVQKELDRVFKGAGPDGFTYDLMDELKYLECCINETLRKYPVVPLQFRTATRDYLIRDSDLVIPKGASVFIPTLAFHRDPEIYENPMEFKPERFLDSSNGGGKGGGVFYTPFGDGPRNCIAMRMGLLTTKIGIALMLSKFNLELTDKEMIHKELEFDPTQLILTPKTLFNIRITPR